MLREFGLDDASGGGGLTRTGGDGVSTNHASPTTKALDVNLPTSIAGNTSIRAGENGNFTLKIVSADTNPSGTSLHRQNNLLLDSRHIRLEPLQPDTKSVGVLQTENPSTLNAPLLQNPPLPRQFLHPPTFPSIVTDDSQHHLEHFISHSSSSSTTKIAAPLYRTLPESPDQPAPTIFHAHARPSWLPQYVLDGFIWTVDLLNSDLLKEWSEKPWWARLFFIALFPFLVMVTLLIPVVNLASDNEWRKLREIEIEENCRCGGGGGDSAPRETNEIDRTRAVESPPNTNASVHINFTAGTGRSEACSSGCECECHRMLELMAPKNIPWNRTLLTIQVFLAPLVGGMGWSKSADALKFTLLRLVVAVVGVLLLRWRTVEGCRPSWFKVFLHSICIIGLFPPCTEYLMTN